MARGRSNVPCTLVREFISLKAWLICDWYLTGEIAFALKPRKFHDFEIVFNSGSKDSATTSASDNEPVVCAPFFWSPFANFVPSPGASPEDS
jgi:hypothetical protein